MHLASGSLAYASCSCLEVLNALQVEIVNFLISAKLLAHIWASCPLGSAMHSYLLSRTVGHGMRGFEVYVGAALV